MLINQPTERVEKLETMLGNILDLIQTEYDVKATVE